MSWFDEVTKRQCLRHRLLTLVATKLTRLRDANPLDVGQWLASPV